MIAATHRNLRAKIADRSFRDDLYYRLAVVEVQVPALRERKDDLPVLVERFLVRRDPPRTLAELPPDTLSLFSSYDWPGNVRELRNVVARLVLFPELIQELVGSSMARSEDALRVSPSAPGRAPNREKPAAALDPEEERLGRLLDLSLPAAREVMMEQFERSFVSIKLKRHGGVVSHAADAMGVSRQHVHRLIERYGLRAK